MLPYFLVYLSSALLAGKDLAIQKPKTIEEIIFFLLPALSVLCLGNGILLGIERARDMVLKEVEKAKTAR